MANQTHKINKNKSLTHPSKIIEYTFIFILLPIYKHANTYYRSEMQSNIHSNDRSIVNGIINIINMILISEMEESNNIIFVV